MALPQKVVIAIGTGALAVATAAVAIFEGYRPQAYADPVGIPTICYGHTAGVRLGQRKTQAECEALLRADWRGHGSGGPPCVGSHDGDTARRAGVLRLQRRPDRLRGQHAAAQAERGRCDRGMQRIAALVMSKGSVLPGPVERRKQERELCLM